MVRNLTRNTGWLLSVGLVALLMFLAILYFFYPPVISHQLTKKKLIALTVDDGPDPLYSSEILAIMKKYGVKATFFVVGRNVEKYPQLVKMELAGGHEIGNHSYSHSRLNHLNSRAIEQEITRTNGIIHKFVGQNVTWFRPPYGAYHLRVIQDARNLGLKTVMWTSALETGRINDPELMARHVLNQAVPGGIILLHDSRVDRKRTIKALPAIIEGLQNRGYRFVTLSELFSEGRGNR